MDLSMEIGTYCNKCVSSNILENQDKFPPDKSVIISLDSFVLYRFY